VTAQRVRDRRGVEDVTTGRVDEQVDVRTDLAGLVADAAVQLRVEALQRVEQTLERARRHGDARRPAARRAERSGDFDGDGRFLFHGPCRKPRV